MVSARFRRHSRRAAKSFRNNMLSSKGCKVGFHLEVLSSQLAAYIGQLQKEIHPTVQKGCEITSQQKGDFAALCKMLPLAWSDWLAMAATSSFQLRIEHRLKNWIVDFLRFEMHGIVMCLLVTSSVAYVIITNLRYYLNDPESLANEDALTLGEQVATLQDEHQDSHFPIDVKLGPRELG
uniref:Uncharacterized protein n=1 Tax=Vitis vinifera TaxID=29760 RepID=A5BF77_VITVI|nr:hypothetical protein VITISV_015311 [Vitis vinifera]